MKDEYSKCTDIFMPPLHYFPQVEVSKKDILKFAKRYSYDKYLKPRAIDFLGKDELIYAQPNSNGTLRIDGSKYESIGQSSDFFIYKDAIITILKERLDKISYLYASKGKDAETLVALKKLVTQFFEHTPDVINPIIRPYFYNPKKYLKNKSTVINPATKKLIISEGVKRIMPLSCSNCNIEEVVFPKSLETIEREAFKNCHMKEITLPDKIKLSSGAFMGCEKLISVKLEGSAVIDKDAFKDCPNLKTIVQPNETKPEDSLTKSF